MSRTVKLILTIILIIAAAIWLLTVYRSCQNTKKNNTEITTNGTGTEGTNPAAVDTSSLTGLEDLYEEEEEEESDSTNASGNTGDSANTSNKETDDEEEDNTTNAEYDAFVNRSGDYLVVAGAFVAKSNADKYKKQLEKEGYDVEVRIFLGSDYHSVILGDYATEGEASGVVKKLGGEAYVHKRRPLKKRR
ncbi:MAG: cell division protein FtsN [Saprospiraceae bacterium]|jgi:cell division protein FtsN